MGGQPDYLQWDDANGNGYSDQTGAYNMNNYGGNGQMTQTQYDQSAPSTQLARRPMSRHLVPTAQRMTHDTAGDQWGDTFGDNVMLDPQGANGMLEENDNIEALEEKAAAAKRDAQSKRKQIPPFVQKLSR